ncbi:esterase-like activity of phytase family protein [Bosea sp. (in: a-proteobacteria)]|uniref:esterase-like activity of phytase family protein n=1 Tax=Bosea sp. (in: a-proteobacteria) TaxID=1871050 RepID=UPI00273706E1|nr:esterase-like activity of phytase family protein [Bosea sp. (in: a-proteobacteria)]MDP3408520.1 esterase-like activity of phytase family protein [Bosea sp. (in: a-proteobacteria)]
MRLTRRSALGGLGALAVSPCALAEASETGAIPVAISARPIAAFEPRNPEKTRFGQLVFRSGLVLSGSHARFGGLSGLWRSANGRDLVAVTDNGFWLTAKLAARDGRLTGLVGAELSPILGTSGKPLHRSRYYDTESLCIADGVAYLGVERTHDVLRFDWAGEGVMARARLVPVPREAKRLPDNRGLEAIGVVPAGQPLAGAIVAISERSGSDDEPTLGVILGRQPGLFQVARHGGFDITDLAFLPNGDMLLLERWYRTLRGVGMRIRRVPAVSLKAGAVLDGPTLIQADLGQEIDNMEGLSVHQEGAKTVLTLISDDNFSILQRTVLLEFELT